MSYFRFAMKIRFHFLLAPAIEFFADEQLQVLQERYLEQGQGLQAFDAAVRDDKGPLPATFLLQDIWMFGFKPTSEVTAVAQTPLCRCQLGLGIYNVQAAVEGMDGGNWWDGGKFLWLGSVFEGFVIPFATRGVFFGSLIYLLEL